ncbi:unnamed protein product [Acanthosepion pharaonis]|uniref:Uncharacterized protein n=1 Tax=Acanthosepion pharaonis TaxID=158019 RepID=A0A812CTZ6_ACAPH|nr:unnamed protein product [Sepia pharaonis]
MLLPYLYITHSSITRPFLILFSSFLPLIFNFPVKKLLFLIFYLILAFLLRLPFSSFSSFLFVFAFPLRLSSFLFAFRLSSSPFVFPLRLSSFHFAFRLSSSPFFTHTLIFLISFAFILNLPTHSRSSFLFFSHPNLSSTVTSFLFTSTSPTHLSSSHSTYSGSFYSYSILKGHSLSLTPSFLLSHSSQLSAFPPLFPFSPHFLFHLSSKSFFSHFNHPLIFSSFYLSHPPFSANFVLFFSLLFLLGIHLIHRRLHFCAFALSQFFFSVTFHFPSLVYFCNNF